VSALEPVLRDRGGVWVGWPGVANEDIPPESDLVFPDDGPVRYRAVPLSAREIALYYSGFSNRTLWPLFHYFVDRAYIGRDTWRLYERVNERFADAVLDAADPNAQVWIHDYQLLRVAHHLRLRRAAARVAFFLHVPFPSADVLRVLPWARALLRGMLAADLVGFHTNTYVEHFLLSVERLLGCEVDWSASCVRFDQRQVAVHAHPISIDVQQVERLAAEAPAPEGRAGRGVVDILGVDRLDYTKGLRERLLAVEQLLSRYPQYHRVVRFTQILVPSRERVADYGILKREIDEAVGRINGRFSEPGWTPIRYLARAFEPPDLVRMYRDADVALVTPLRDGMNLVAKEYVASQLENDGVLVLSELAGAAEELQEAITVNPFDVDAVTEALHRALTMPDDERMARMSSLRDRVRSHDVHRWVTQFLGAAEQASQARAAAEAPVDQVRRRLAPWLAQRPTLALFVDYDGTLTPIVDRPECAELTEPQRQVLIQALRAPNVDVTIVSGRALEDIKRRVGVDGITYVGNHGYEIEGPGVSFIHGQVGQYQRQLDEAAHELEALGVPGATVERKGPTISYHVRTVNPGDRRRAERQATAILRRAGLLVSRGTHVLEGRPPVDWHKGHAVLHVLTRRHGAQWPARVRVLYVGDDATDEDAFRTVRGMGRSIYVSETAGGGETADYRLPSPDAVQQLLRWIASGAFRDGV